MESPENKPSYNPMARNPNDFDIKVGSYDAKTFNGHAVYSTKVCGAWENMLKAKAREAGMAVNAYVQKMVEERFSPEFQVELARMHGVTLAQQRRELFMHVWPDLPVWNVWSNRVLVPANASPRGRPSGSKNTSHKSGGAPILNASHAVNEPPMRNAYNDVMLDPTDYLTLREIAEARNVTPQQLLRDLAHKACANYRAAKAVEQEVV